MLKAPGRFLIALLLILPTAMVFVGTGVHQSGVAAAEDSIVNDPLEGEDEETTVETDEGATEDAGPEDTQAMVSDKGEEEEEEEKPLRPSPDADTYILFTNPLVSSELPAGKVVRLLVGLTNKGDKNFIIDTMDASFRYPQDYSYYIQNFTTVRYNQLLEPKHQATFEYDFAPNEAFHARPFGLTINLNYHDVDSNLYQSTVFNETVNVIEPDEGLDGETFFLYVFLAAVVVLLLVGAQQLFGSFGRKRLSKPRQTIKLGTQNKDVDYDWIPKETLMKEFNKSPRRFPSPRQRHYNKRSTGAGDEGQLR